eukprot:c20459_g1_i7.p2 GENE.c20459_g1_i7~~c20459_g1_i7.p2  ORF type:complete len:274 (-),score=35.97 c20459_g1_i7:2781-3602(-)
MSSELLPAFKATTQPPEQQAQYFQTLGTAAMWDGRHKDAVKWLSAAHHVSPSWHSAISVILAKIQCCLCSGLVQDVTKLAHSLEVMTTEKGGFPDATRVACGVAIAECLSCQGQQAQALASLDKLPVNQDELKCVVQRTRGRVCERFELGSGRQHLISAIEIAVARNDQSLVLQYAELASSYTQTGHMKEAETTLKRAIDLIENLPATAFTQVKVVLNRLHMAHGFNGTNPEASEKQISKAAAVCQISTNLRLPSLHNLVANTRAAMVKAKGE